MVDVKPTNAKLIRRTVNLTMLATGASEATARATLEACEHHVKTAIVAITKKISVADAKVLLADTGGNVRQAIGK
jgi:N-acetylmuramic acid 6-phosphate etherase